MFRFTPLPAAELINEQPAQTNVADTQAILVLALRRVDRHSRSSLSLTQSYENIVFDHRAGDCRVFQLLSVTKERGDCGNDLGYDDPCSVDLG